jgi:hypothetical protein
MLTSIFSAMFGLTWFSCSPPQVGHLSGTWPGKRTSPIGGNTLLQLQEGQRSLKAGDCIGINCPLSTFQSTATSIQLTNSNRALVAILHHYYLIS